MFQNELTENHEIQVGLPGYGYERGDEFNYSAVSGALQLKRVSGFQFQFALLKFMLIIIENLQK